MIKPLRGNIFIEVIKEEKTTASGIILTSSLGETERGLVTAVGAEVLQVKVGDVVLLKKYGPEKIKIDGQDLCIAEEDDLIGIQE